MVESVHRLFETVGAIFGSIREGPAMAGAGVRRVIVEVVVEAQQQLCRQRR